jgi:hypothetical protein
VRTDYHVYRRLIIILTAADTCTMTLTPSDILEIQSAIDRYEKKFPRRPSPSVAEALAWRQGKREARDPGSSGIDTESSRQECNQIAGTGGKIRLRVWYVRKHRPGLPLWVKGALLLCWCGMVAVLTTTCFLFGAFVGGFKWVP